MRNIILIVYKIAKRLYTLPFKFLNVQLIKRKYRSFRDRGSFFENWHTRAMEQYHILPKHSLIKYRLRNGMQFYVRPYTSDVGMVISIVKYREYQKYFDINPSDVVIDIGANIGAFSCSIAYADPTVQVYAFEPLLLHFNILTKNVSINNLKNVHPYNLAIAEEFRISNIFYEDEWSASASLLDSYYFKNKKYQSQNVQCIPFQDIFTSHGIKHCNFLKIDCEGAEYMFLLNTPLSIFKKIDKIAMEFHDYDDKHNFLDLAKLLEGVGFRIIIPKVYSFITTEGKEKQVGMLYGWKEEVMKGSKEACNKND